MVVSQLGPPHEHKGPEDFSGKRDDEDEDEDENTPAPDETHHTPQPQQGPPAMAPPHIPSHPGFQHVNHAPSASPPIPNGMSFVPRHGTPQPQGASRPSSRNHIRRVSSNLAPQQHATPPPPPHNGMAYMPNPSMYSHNSNPNLGQHSRRPSPFPQFSHTPPVTHHQTPPPQAPHQSLTPQPMPAHTMPSQSIPQHPMAPPHAHAFAQPPPPMALSQPPHPPLPHVAQAYMHEQGRNSMPPAFTTEQPPQQPHLAPPRTVSLPDASSAGQVKPEGSHSPPTHHRSLSSKSRSIFTPIDDRGSVLARHFGLGASGAELPRSDVNVKPEPSQEDTNETRATDSPTIPPPPPPPRVVTEPPRTQSISSISSDINPPTRTNSGQSKRPQLKVQIPSENSDTAESSSRDSAGNKTLTPAKANAETNHSGVVLPPPSPSAGAILSAGAQGPPNPFARPPPPVTAAQNNNAYASNNNIETPISALPSRFVSDALLPSPSSFFPEWGFGRSGPDTNMLPSPLTFPTPAAQTGPGFAREDEQDKKRKTPDSGPSGEGASKKPKT